MDGHPVERSNFMERRMFALWCVVAGLIVGLAGNMLFYGQMIGLSFLIYSVICLLVLFVVARAAKTRLNPRNLWLVLPLLFFASMVMFRANAYLITINVLATTGLGLLIMHYATATHPLDTESLGELVGAASAASIRSVTDTPMEIGDSWRYIRETGLQQRQGTIAFGRGLLLTIPVLLVFAVLLASADQVFGKYLDSFFSALSLSNFDDFMGRAILTLSLGWVAIGGLSYALARRQFDRPQVTKPTLVVSRPAAATPPIDQESPAVEGTDTLETAPAATPIAVDEPAKRKNTPIQLTMIETTMMLGSVNVLFAAFVVIQFAYLFGGQTNINTEGFTYAEYARRGFWELLAVTMLSLGMGLFLDWVTIRRGTREINLFRGLAVVLSALVGVLIFSASQRMSLYEQVYGFTDDRVFVSLFIFWVGLLFPAFLLHLFRVRQNIFALAVLLVTIGYTGHINLLNYDLYIAQHNIDRYYETGKLDVCYLETLSVDALPAILTLREEARENNPTLFAQINSGLMSMLYNVTNERRWTTTFSYNTARDNAWYSLQAIRPELDANEFVSCYDYDPDNSYGRRDSLSR
jgi:hypothetical protein